MSGMVSSPEVAWVPDARDGLNRVQRVVLLELRRALAETGRDHVPAPMLYGRVVEHVDLGEAEFRAVLDSLGASVSAGPDRSAGDEP